MTFGLRARFAGLALPGILVAAVSLSVGALTSRDSHRAVSEVTSELHVTLIAERLVRAIDAHSKECLDVLNSKEPEAAGRAMFARKEGEAALVEWRKAVESLEDSDDKARLTSELRIVEERFARLSRVADRAIALAKRGERQRAEKLIAFELDSMTPGLLRADLARFIDDQEIRLTDSVSEVETIVSGSEVLIGVMGALVLVISGATAWILSRWLLGPIRELELAARRVGEGHLDVRVKAKSRDELGLLFATFNRMVEDLCKHRDDSARTEEELRSARDEARAASRTKSEFLANMSHEIRTPLNGILGMIELTLDSELSSEQLEYLSTAQTSADGLLSVISDILDFSKIEAGHLELDPQPFDVRSCVERVCKTLALRAHQKNLELICQVAEEIPDCVIGDEARLRQILVNLIGNAVKFTESGEVVVVVDLEAGHGGVAPIRFQVMDTGIGIPAEKHAYIFDSFTQADASTTRRYGGTGLGLAISSRLAAKMGGKLRVDSASGRGSTFSFAIDMPRTANAPSRPLDREIREVLGGRPALVVDDNATNRRILERMLVVWGADVQSVESATRALSALEVAVHCGRPFSLVLLDANMPGMDGFSLAEEIQRRPSLASPRIMMLSSAHRPGDIARCRELGVALHLVKPVGRSELRTAILQVLSEAKPIQGSERRPSSAQSPPQERESGTSSEDSARSPGLRILLAEDNVINQKFVRTVLERAGHTVTLAKDGRKALQCVNAGTFDVILLDVHMPELSGLEVAQRIRADEEGTGRHVPLLALTARAMQGDREICIEAGMDDYVSKPVRSKDLLDALDRNVGRKPAGDASARPSPLSTTTGTEIEDELGAMFLEFRSGLENDLASALGSGDAGALASAAHRLKGAVGNLQGAGRSVMLCDELERAGRSGRCREVEPTCRELQGEIAMLCDALSIRLNSGRS